nr:hypothetical protein [Bacteroidales bacterium]
MEEVWKFLRKESDEMRSCFRVSDKIELLFDMGCYCVVISIKDDCTCFNDKDNYDSIEDEDLSKINILSIQKINIYCGTCLYIEDGREYAETLHPFNYIVNMLLKHINNKFRDSISCSNLGTYCFDDSCIMCDDVWEYGFVIDINSHWNDVDFFVFFHQIMNKLFLIKTPTFYSNANNILDSLEVSMLPSNTKTRRLGYLKLI